MKKGLLYKKMNQNRDKTGNHNPDINNTVFCPGRLPWKSGDFCL